MQGSVDSVDMGESSNGAHGSNAGIAHASSILPLPVTCRQSCPCLTALPTQHSHLASVSVVMLCNKHDVCRRAYCQECMVQHGRQAAAGFQGHGDSAGSCCMQVAWSHWLEGRRCSTTGWCWPWAAAPASSASQESRSWLCPSTTSKTP